MTAPVVRPLKTSPSLTYKRGPFPWSNSTTKQRTLNSLPTAEIAVLGLSLSLSEVCLRLAPPPLAAWVFSATQYPPIDLRALQALSCLHLSNSSPPFLYFLSSLFHLFFFFPLNLLHLCEPQTMLLF